MSKYSKNKFGLFVAALGLWFVGIIAWYLHGKNFAVLSPQGPIAGKERNLLFITLLLGLAVIIPVFILLFTFAWKYREGNKSSKYTPDVSGNHWLEAVWWGIPSAIILVLSIITWNSSHDLDPHKPLASGGQAPLTIQVVALDWKWLFIYPREGVASVDWVQLPIGVPVTFNITSDAPMNSFWIPQLGGQIYAMPGMSTQLHLLADREGDYAGSSANISGRGFAGMRFTARAGSDREFAQWLESARHSPLDLSSQEYTQLARPSENMPKTLYSSVDKNLYDKVILKYMVPGGYDAR